VASPVVTRRQIGRWAGDKAASGARIRGRLHVAWQSDIEVRLCLVAVMVRPNQPCLSHRSQTSPRPRRRTAAATGRGEGEGAAPPTSHPHWTTFSACRAVATIRLHEARPAMCSGPPCNGRFVPALHGALLFRVWFNSLLTTRPGRSHAQLPCLLPIRPAAYSSRFRLDFEPAAS
jgi:hypothetical protein